MQADVLTLSSLGCHPLSVVTALTVQDTSGVNGLFPIAPDWVRRQAECVLADVRVTAFKLGVLGSAENARAIARVLGAFPAVPVVLDPVLASARGEPLADEDTLAALRDDLLPRATIVTPNSIEARRLGGGAEAEDADLAQCARRMLARGCRFVLITGTHEPGDEVVNTLYQDSGLVREERWRRLPGSYHGSGCTLASAIAAYLGRGLDMPDAVGRAQRYTWQALAAGFQPGGGQHIPDRHAGALDEA